MFSNHLIVKNNNEQVLYLYVDYNFEFATLGKNGKKSKDNNIYQNIINYIRDKKINFDGTKIFLVVNGIIIGTLFLSNYPYQNLRVEASPKFQYVEYIKDFEHPTFNIEEKEHKYSETIEVKEEIDTTINDEKTTPTPTPEKKKETVTREETKKEPTNKIDNKKTTKQDVVLEEQKLVTLYRSNGTIEQIELENYIIGVVAAEMPAAFHLEALKAQAVAARTYTLKRLSENKVLTDSISHQSYKDNTQLKAFWGNNFNTYYNKIKNAVDSTKGEYISYKNKYIDALYHSTSNGKTENAMEVWGNNYPYLVSVNSHWDKDAPSYLRETSRDIALVNSILGINITEKTNIEVISLTSGNSIHQINIDNKSFSGKFIRESFGLRSTDFDIEINGDQVIFITRGYGHGVGMSQYGANGMAKDGYSYKQILIHYYPGTNLTK